MDYTIKEIWVLSILKDFCISLRSSKEKPLFQLELGSYRESIQLISSNLYITITLILKLGVFAGFVKDGMRSILG